MLDRYQRLLELVRNLEDDYNKFFVKENREAGVRARKQLQDIRAIAKAIRQDIQETKQDFAPKIVHPNKQTHS